MPITFPLISCSAIIVLVGIGRPLFFVQKRPGFQGKVFNLIKFRTMKLGSESDEQRITPVGRFLRTTSLDELPTLWNVLVGDMSLVGPRPLLVQYLERYTPEQKKRHEVRPGLTGLAQVNGRNLLSWEQKFDLDLEYVRKASFKLDVLILFKTIYQVLRRSGISPRDSITMPEFRGR